jgi:hypothetical protein
VIATVHALELCPTCDGTGILGRVSGFSVICEDCCDSLYRWVERCALVGQEKEACE